MNPTPTPVVAATAPRQRQRQRLREWPRGAGGAAAATPVRGGSWTGPWSRRCASGHRPALRGAGRGPHPHHQHGPTVPGRAIIIDLLEAEAAERIGAGVPTWSASEQDAGRRGRQCPVRPRSAPAAGRRRDGGEHHHHRPRPGHPRTERRTADPRPAVADSDAELIDFLVFLASRSEVNARPFSQAQPRLHLRLDLPLLRTAGLGPMAARAGSSQCAPTARPSCWTRATRWAR